MYATFVFFDPAYSLALRVLSGLPAREEGRRRRTPESEHWALPRVSKENLKPPRDFRYPFQRTQAVHVHEQAKEHGDFVGCPRHRG
jgi:hypothetical protein